MIRERKSIKATKSKYSYARVRVDRPEGAKSVPHLMPANAGAATEDWSQTKRRKPQAYAARKGSIEGQNIYLAQNRLSKRR